MTLRDHLAYTAAHMDCIPQAHKRYLVRLKESGFEPGVVYDIGAHLLHWTSFARKLWPGACFVLFDAFEPAAFLYEDYPHHVGVLSDRAGRVVRWYQNDLLPGGNSYYKERDDAVFPPEKFVERRADTLDDVVREKGFPPPDLVKIDVQGCERDVLLGARNTLAQTRHIVIEMQHEEYNLGAPTIAETTATLGELGFGCVAPLFCNNGPDGDYGFARITP